MSEDFKARLDRLMTENRVALDRLAGRAPSDMNMPDEQVAELRERQANERLHPYTCGNDSGHAPLVPTAAGWVCTDCDYTQRITCAS